MEAKELLLKRRSIRYFKNIEVPNEVLDEIFEICRFSPTSKNCQSYYFIVIKNRKILNFLGDLRGESSAPIKRAPMAIAVCVDTTKTKRPEADGHIAAYHFILACWIFGLGTCWIAGMNRNEVKDMLTVPEEHFIATIIPVGYPEFIPEPPPRRKKEEFLKFI
jgi:nitroreductase